VGFRPAVHRLAVAHGITGSVRNRAGTVELVVEGPRAAVDAFWAALPTALPRHARIESADTLAETEIPEEERQASFEIVPSDRGTPVAVTIPPDLRICPACAREVLDPADRRYRYPFTTCVDCGPRYTVVESMPYDRRRTTLRDFPLCDACRNEYETPGDRRFHAEAVACPVCGPRPVLLDPGGAPAPGDPLQTARARLAAGDGVAVKGIGGFLLAANAFDRAALRRLRAAKRRPHKPFAVMAASRGVLERYCSVPAAAAELLDSAEGPIVILDTLPEPPGDAPPLPLDLLTPDAATLGAMLPTSPLHLLLAQPTGDDPTPPFDLLVMTSGNRGGEPICLSAEEALERLDGIADAFLVHDRRICLRNDDSVCVIRGGRPQVWRRARGYAPGAVALPHPLQRCVLAMGAEIKNTIAVGDRDRVTLSPHVGDLESPEAMEGLDQVADRLPAFLGRTPEVVAVDTHPDMHSTRRGRFLAERLGVPVREIQHHHAHGLACLAENGRIEGLVLAFDGTGLGADDSIWGAELLEVTPRDFRRLATFAPVPLPGGDAAVLHPERQLVARWWAAGIEPAPGLLALYDIRPEDAAAWTAQCRRSVNAPLTHAAGRLFDAFAALLRLPPRGGITYEAQAAIRVEQAARRALAADTRPAGVVRYDLREEAGLLMVDWSPSFLRAPPPAAITESDVQALALNVHAAVASAAVEMVSYGFARSPFRVVALTGGVMMNRVLHDRLVRRLEALGADVAVHRAIPPNDACIALGQAVAAGLGGEDDNGEDRLCV